MKNTFYLFMLFFIILIMVTCEKYDEPYNSEMIIGKWTSIDKIDTLEFDDNGNLYKSTINIRHEHFDYKILRDSIEIKYSGLSYILIYPTKHKYSIIDNKLSIDFSNKPCYGFTSGQLISYVKE